MTGRCSDNSYHSTPYLFGRAFRTPVFPLFFGRPVLFFRGFRGGGLVDLAVELVETVLRSDEIFRRLDRLGGSRDIVHGDEVLHFIVLKVVHELQRKQENETDGNGQKERAPDGEKPERNIHDDDEVDRRKEGGKAAPESLAGAHGVFERLPHPFSAGDDGRDPCGNERHLQRLQEHDERDRKTERDEHGQESPRRQEGRHIEEEKPAYEHGDRIVQKDDGHIDDLIQRGTAEAFEVGGGKARTGEHAHPVVHRSRNGKETETVEKAGEQIDKAHAHDRARNGAAVPPEQRKKVGKRRMEIGLEGLQYRGIAAEQGTEELLRHAAERFPFRALHNDGKRKTQDDVHDAERDHRDDKAV